MSGYKHHRLFSVPPGAAFLPTVAAALCEGRLVPGFTSGADPLVLASATIFVPTRRAARELRSAFLDQLGGASALLPRIKPLGEFDEDVLLFSANGADTVATLPAIDPLERQMELGLLIASWTQHLKEKHLRLYGDDIIETPVSIADAFWMARDLASLLDQLETEGIGFADIEAAAREADISQWWEVTAAFLEIIRTQWPAVLAEKNRINPAAWRNAMLEGEAKRLKETAPAGPVIVAGSTGTIPKTAELIGVVSRLEKGAVVLPGFDSGLDVETARLLVEPDDIGSAIGHPQYGMHQLLRTIGAPADAVENLVEETTAARARRLWVAHSLEPAPGTARWPQTRRALDEAAFDGVAILHAANEREEAAAIAAAIREAIADPDVHAALVTPDRTLARRVVSELSAFGIDADDSGGQAFNQSLPGLLLSQTMAVAFGDHDPAALLALLKNPLVRIGCERAVHDRAVLWLEMLVLRGRKRPFELASFATYCEHQLSHWSDERHTPGWFGAVSADDIMAVRALGQRIGETFKPLVALAGRGADTDVAAAIGATIRVVEALAMDQDGDLGELYGDEAGNMLRGLLGQFLSAETSLRFAATEWKGILSATTSAMVMKPERSGHPRVSIWGALEARLQTVDLMVLGGLNEGVWPALPSQDAFLTRGVKDRISMEPPERRIGLAAHDFQMAMGQKQVLITRSQRIDNAPAVPSRWLQRMETFAGEETTKELHRRGQRLAHIATALAKPRSSETFERPCPKPSLEQRPRHFSVTEIERLRRDPYAIYAKRILDLQPLDGLTREPDAAERGNLFHDILRRAVDTGLEWTAADAGDRLETITDAVLAEAKLPADIHLLWRSRFVAAIPEILKEERKIDAETRKRHAEVRARATPIDASDVTLGGRADRLDERVDGTFDILDYKTGNIPSVKQVKAMFAPQLPLEAALLARGAFEGLGEAETRELAYLKIGNKGEVKRELRGGGTKKDDKPSMELAETAWRKLVDLVAFYASPETGYLSRAIPKEARSMDGDYDHLARVKEWSAGMENDEGDFHE